MLVFKSNHRKTLDGILIFLLEFSPLAAEVNKIFLFFQFLKEIFKNISSSKSYNTSLALMNKNIFFENIEITF